jgi:amino acid permease
MTVGVCGSYLVFIGSSLSYLLQRYDHRLTTTICTMMILPPIILLSWARSYKLLAPTAALGVTALIFSVSASLYDAARTETLSPLSGDDMKIHYFKLDTFPLFIGNAAFLYLIHSVILPTQQSMKNPNQYGIALDSRYNFINDNSHDRIL